MVNYVLFAGLAVSRSGNKLWADLGQCRRSPRAYLRPRPPSTAHCPLPAKSQVTMWRDVLWG